MKLWLNGKLIEDGQARIDPADRGLMLSDGLFETIAVREGKARRFAAHYVRLQAGATALGIPLRYGDQYLSDLIAQVAAANGGLQNGVARITLTRGPAPRGLAPPPRPTPTLMVTIADALPPPGPAEVIIAASTRRNEQSPLARVKSLGQLDNIIARSEASSAGVDDALLLNTQGRIAESTIANLFILIDGAIVTPPVSEGALPGVMRAEIIRLTRAEERPMPAELVARASEVFLTNALGLRSVVRIGTQAVGDGEPGLITQLLATRV